MVADANERLTRVEAKQESIDTYLPALLNAVERSQVRIEEAVRFTRIERMALIVAISALPISILVAAFA